MTFQFEINAVTPLRQNCTSIWDGETREAVLTDVDDVLYLLQQVQNEGFRLAAAWLIHDHLGHTGGAAEFLRTRNVPVLGPHKDDEFPLQALPQTTTQYGFPASLPFTPTHWLEEGETLKVGDHSSQILHTPGHIPDQIVFYNAENGPLVAGDALFYEAVGRTDFPHGSRDDLINNIYAKLLTLPGST